MIGKTISHYKILEKIGQGGMGEVYRAEDIKLERKVALKFLPSNLTTDIEAVERFKREAKAAAALNHPNIVTIYETGEFEGQIYIAMEYVVGESLRQKISDSILTMSEIIDVVVQICEGLGKAHKAGIVHRDIKPENIFIDEDGRIKILDFGLAKLKGVGKLTKETSTLGTVYYMSPEQVRGKEVDNRTDIWSLGIILYEMLTGHLPFKGDYEQAVMYSILNEKPTFTEEITKPFPDLLISVIEKSLQKEPNQRYTSALEFKRDLEQIQSEWMGSVPGRSQMAKRYLQPKILIPIGIFVIMASIFLVRQFHNLNQIRWAREVALPKIEELNDKAGFIENNIEAFNLAVKAEKFIPNDQKLIQFMNYGSGTISIHTQPSGARIFRKPFDKPENDWEWIGTSPLVSKRMPYYLFHWKIEKPEYETMHRLAFSGKLDLEKSRIIENKIDLILDKKGSLPSSMVLIPGTGEIPDFYIDKYEVTNKQFKQFVEKGGYRDRKYWKFPFQINGGKVNWDVGISRFRDTTGRLGPANWEGGDYPEGEDDYPVSGISWYEAAAYADFVEKSLPTTSHWNAARRGDYFGAFHLFISMSNLGGKSTVPVGTTKAITHFGVYDMAGNVREWCWNESQKGRCICGGAWSDVSYMYSTVSQADPFDRSPKNGLRCAIYPDKELLPEHLFESSEIEQARNFYKEIPVSDAIFNIYKDMFSYDEIDLNAIVEEADEHSTDWIHYKISFTAAYDNERMIIHLFLPKNANPPYQTVIYFPGSGSVYRPTSDEIENCWEFTNNLSFIVKSGRAVVYPVYKGTFERIDGIPSELHDREDNSIEFKNYTIKIVQDFKRVIDYLETNRDIDNDKLGYFGFSWGGQHGSLIPAVENRIKISILNVGGMEPWWQKTRPEIEYINYVYRVKIPTLMLNGKYDTNIDFERATKPMFDLLGTPDEDKKLVVYETDHIIPRKELIRESLAWLDKYFGPVKWK